MKEERVGTVVNFFSRPMAAAVRIEKKALARGDAIHIKGRATDLYHRIDSMEIDRSSVRHAAAGEVVGIRLAGRVRRRDKVYKLEE